MASKPIRSKAILFFAVISFYTIANSQEKPEIKMGGALRFNYNSSSWKNNQTKRGGDFGFDVFRINADAAYKGLKLKVEYRLYDPYFGGGMLKYGWIQYDINNNENIQLGLTKVPFGITPYNSNSWFSSINYYIGKEDDHDMGVKYSFSNKRWDFLLAFFKNAEENIFGNLTDLSSNRYAYDVGSYRDDNENQSYRNKEQNQINLKTNYKFGKLLKSEIGASGEYGYLLNLDTEDMGTHYSWALHYQATYNNWNIKAQITGYEYNPETPRGERNDIIALAAFGAPYLIASKATTYTIGINHSFPIKWGPISSVIVYNDFGYMDKKLEEFEDSLMNDFGLLITAGSIYTYIDFASGKNHSWIGDNYYRGLAEGNPNANWENRFNINIGYYF